MKYTIYLLFIFIIASCTQSSHEKSAVSYHVTFPNYVHHEAEISVTISDIKQKTLQMRMARTSPGRYALHEFAKNVYNVKAFDSKGNTLAIDRPNLHQWDISGHDGTVRVTYTLFGNRGDGTYSQIDESHAHLNIPATFMYAKNFVERPIEVTFDAPKGLNWKVATQLKQVGEFQYWAPNQYYFMDSPIELSDHILKSKEIEDNGHKYEIKMAIHHMGTDEEADMHFEQTIKMIQQAKAVFGELPNFDFGSYTFLACYMPQASGDGMEHRNSTILTSTLNLEKSSSRLIGTVSHEFFHSWNVERLRPLSLEPFDFEKANMSDALWFAEGFTSYYDGLLLCRAGVISEEEFVHSLARSLSYVINSPAWHMRNPLQMSDLAPFVDAATAVDELNWQNTFISYYSYGDVLGLALDLSLRNQGNSLTLDGFMKLMWDKYGKNEVPYNIPNLQSSLGQYAGKAFANDFFDKYIHGNTLPDYEALLKTVGVSLLKENEGQAYFGANVRMNNDSSATIEKGTQQGTPAYEAGLDKGDVLLQLDEKALDPNKSFAEQVQEFKIGDQVKVSYRRFGQEKETTVALIADPSFKTVMTEEVEQTPNEAQHSLRKDWLSAK